MTVYLINPSHVSFGIGVITPRWLVRPGVRDAGEVRPADAGRRDPGTIRPEPHRHRRHRRHRHPYRQRAPRLRDRHRGARGWRLRGLWRHPCHAVPGRGPRSRRRARRGDGRRRAGVAGGPSRLRRWRAAARSTTAAASRARRSCPAAGICCPPAAICGRRCRRFADVRSIARSARCGGPTVSVRVSGTSIACSKKSSICAGADSGSSRSPTTTSIR